MPGKMFSFLLDVTTFYTWLLFFRKRERVPFWVKRDTPERSIVNLDNCATFESVESELRCLDRGVYTGRDSRFGQSVEFLREEDIFYEKSVFALKIFLWNYYFASFFLVLYGNTNFCRKMKYIFV